ncbi:MAG: hypothetical protein C4551_01885 [Bacillota bacterium]|jgi:hypothetical protein|nr:MAG: hypothetical protein C4551_01885 [Bacillota bacterium]
MRVGTKSLLFGVHQVLLHPLCVWLAWRKLYGTWPGWRETICIVVHDWGYWGLPNMDGPEGEQHPRLGARIALRLFGARYWVFCIGHSRQLANLIGTDPSRLCWADKFGVTLMPAWLYLLLGRLSGEVYEYRAESIKAGFMPPGVSLQDWHRRCMDYLRTVALQQVAAPVSAGSEAFRRALQKR